MSNFLNVSVLVLATMVLVLAGMLGYLYWQQNKLMRAMTALSGFVQSQFTPPLAVDESPETQPDPQETHHQDDQDDEDDSEDEDDDSDDDRVSVELVEELVEQKVEQKVQVPEVPAKAEAEAEAKAEADNDSDVTSKTMPQLREILNKRGIPFGKRDSKSVLIELLKASS
jgi:hypothetical protein